jgi:HEPN domain-containing protein
MKRLTREWVRKAEDDYSTSHLLATSSEPHHDQTCFHCQQSAEKYLKSLLVERGDPVPRTHNLIDLLAILRAIHPDLQSLRRGVDFLTRFAVDFRYPGIRASKRQAMVAVKWMEKVRGACRKSLTH